MISDKLYASTFSNLSSLYLYCTEIKIKNLEHSKNSPPLVLSPPLSPLTAKQSVFLRIPSVGTVKQKGLEWDCVQAQHTIFRFLCHPMGVWCSRTSLAWDCYSYTSLNQFWEKSWLLCSLLYPLPSPPKKWTNDIVSLQTKANHTSKTIAVSETMTGHV